jgi:predicted CxxxxCH...CXXCH cytochrome family protein
MPIFHATCSNDACHGSGEPQGGVYFGSNAQMVYANLVGVAALELPSMSLVEAGDPSNSFVMHKLDSDQCAFSNECAPPGCGAQMPMGSTNPMPLANRNTIRRWIAQGATQN